MKRKTTITLTIAGLLAIAGILYAANPRPFAIVPKSVGAPAAPLMANPTPFAAVPGLVPIGVAAAPTDLYVSEYCTAIGVPFRNIDRIDCNMVVSTVTSIPTIPGCQEMYMAMAPLVSASATPFPFAPRDVFITNGVLIYRFTPPNPPNPLTVADVFAVIPDSGCASNTGGDTGITFDHVGTFGYNMIVTCNTDGNVWQVSVDPNPPHLGVVTFIAGTGSELEGPAVAPSPGFGTYGGQILVADENDGKVIAIDYHAGHVITPNAFTHFDAESVQVIPTDPCTFCGFAHFQAIGNFFFPTQNLYAYPPTDFSGLGGGILVTSESGGTTSVFSWNGSSYDETPFDSINGALYEGSSFVDCDVPSPTPTSPPPSPTSTPTPTPTPTPLGPGCTAPTSIRSNFNGTPINGGNYIWFNSVLKAKGLPPTSAVTITFTNQMITSPNFGPLPVPDASVTFDPLASSATTNFMGGMWVTTAPSFLGGNTFLSGLSFLAPNLPGGINPVTWSGTITIDTPGVSIEWQWAAAVYTNFTTAYNALGVKPVDDNKASQYKNSDHAGTPENYRHFVIGGARGGGGANYTGSYSGTVSVCRQHQ